MKSYLSTPLFLALLGQLSLISSFAPTGTYTPRTNVKAPKESVTALFKKGASNKKKGKPASKGFGAIFRETKADVFPYAGTITPGIQSPQKIVVDESIMKPDYAEDSIVSFLFYERSFDIISNSILS